MAEPDHAAGRRPSLPGWGRLVTLRLVILTSLLFTGATVGCDDGLPDTDWPLYLGSGSSQYSRLGQITRENVAQLEVAWTYHSGDADVDTNRSQMQTSPIVVDGVLYGVSPVTKIFALDAATGARLWQFDPFAAGAEVRGGGTSRGVTYWADGDDRRIFATGGSKLFALDAGTGAPIESFGRGGAVDLHDGLDAGRDVSDLFVISNTPGVIYRDLLILPTRHAESDPAAPGNIRAFDVRTGGVAWVFHTIPHPGELGYDTWPTDAWQRVGAANNWSGMSVDEARGLVFVPTGSATPDFNGSDRHGANLFANTLLALDAATGRTPLALPGGAPRHLGPRLPRPAQPADDRAGRRAPRTSWRRSPSRRTSSCSIATAATRSFRSRSCRFRRPTSQGKRRGRRNRCRRAPPPFTRQRLTEAEATDISPEANRYVVDRLRRMRSDGQFIPTSREGTIILPGLDGGGEWGGAAVDPDTGIMYVNGNDMPWIGAMVEIPPGARGRVASAGHRVYALHCLQCHGVNRAGDELGQYPRLDDLAGRLTEAEARDDNQ